MRLAGAHVPGAWVRRDGLPLRGVRPGDGPTLGGHPRPRRESVDGFEVRTAVSVDEPGRMVPLTLTTIYQSVWQPTDTGPCEWQHELHGTGLRRGRPSAGDQDS